MPGDLTITRLSTTPVKGLLLDHPDSIELTAEGAVGDRAFYLLDDRGKDPELHAQPRPVRTQRDVRRGQSPAPGQARG